MFTLHAARYLSPFKLSLLTLALLNSATALATTLRTETTNPETTNPETKTTDSAPAAENNTAGKKSSANTANQNKPADTSMTISRITVEGKRTSSSGAENIIGSIDVIGRDGIEKESVDMTLELLRKIPGVQYARFNQGVTSANIALRGFNAEGEIHSTKLLIDGIPAQRNNGAHELDALFPLEIAGIEVVKGSSDARYGQHSLAGNINVLTQQELDDTRLRVLAGSFGTQEAQLATGHSSGNFNQTYFASWRETDGYRDHSGLNRKNIAGKWWLRSDSGAWRVGLVARDYELHADAPGYLTQTETRANPRQSPIFSNTDGGDKAVQHFSLHVDASIASELELQARLYRQTVDFRRFVRFTAPENQQERLENETENGALVHLQWSPDWTVADQVSFRIGLDHQAQEVVNQRHRTRERVREGAPTRNQFYTLDNQGGFLHADFSWTSGWRLQTGLRADRLDGHFLNVANGRRSPIYDYGTLLQPKLGLLYGDQNWSTFFNWGRGFQIGYGSAAYRTSSGNLDASTNTGIEFGSRWQMGERFSLRAALWQQHATDEVRLKFDNSGDSENIGETERSGLDFLLTAALSAQTWLWANYTFQDSELVNPGLRDIALKGKRLHHVPEHIASIGLDLKFSDHWRLSSSLQYQSAYELNNANNAGQFGQQKHLQTELLWQQGAITWGLHLKNLLNADNEYVWLDVSGPKFAAGEGRAAYLSADLRF